MLVRFRNSGHNSVQRPSPRYGAIIAFISILCVIVVGHDLLRTWEARYRAIAQSRREVENLAWSASQHAGSAFLLVSTMLAGLAERVEVDDIGFAQLERLQRLMMLRMAGSTMLEDLVLVDANGISVVDGRPQTPKINVADREYYQYLRAHPGNGLHVGMVIRSRRTGRSTIPIARRVNHADGSFAGIVIATLETSYFENFYATFNLGHDGAAGLARDDGEPLVRQSLVAPGTTSSRQSGLAFHYSFPEAASGTYEFVSPLDGVTRILSYRRVDGTPLVVAMALGKAEQLADWKIDAAEHLLATTLVTLLLGCIGVRLVTQVRRIAEVEQAAASAAAKRAAELAGETDLRLLAEDLKISEARYRFISESTNDVIICAQLDLRRTYASPACRAVFGHDPEQMLCQDAAKVHPEDAQMVLEAVAPLSAGAADRALVTYRAQHERGHWIWIEATISLIRDQSTQRPASLVCSLRDISERHLRAEELKRSNAALEQFAYAASHDLQAPLRAIAHLAQWIDEDVRPTASPDTLENLKLLNGRVARLQMLINGLLAYARIGRTDLIAEDVDVAAAVQDVVALLDPNPNFVVTCETEIVSIRTHRPPFQLVLKNLISNALQHHDREEGRVSVVVRLLRDMVEVRISDDGPGIDQRFHKEIFVIFKTLKSRDEIESSGLGLAMVQKQVAENGGRIWVESAPPARGSTFVFTWKLTAGCERSASPAVTAEDQRAGDNRELAFPA